MIRLLSLLAVVLGLMACHASAAETIAVPSDPIAGIDQARPSPRPLSGRLSLPSGQGRFPVVILLHTCGGIDAAGHLDGWVSRLNDWGYAAFVLDSFTARLVRSVCPKGQGGLVTPVDRAGDVINAALALSRHPAIDGSRIGIVGFSHGGQTAVVATRGNFAGVHPGLIKAAVDYYGSCRGPTVHSRIPLLVLTGDLDTGGDPPTTCAALAAALKPDQGMELHIYKGVYHAFDQNQNIPGRAPFGYRMQYDGEATRDSYVRTRAFLDAHLLNAHAAGN